MTLAYITIFAVGVTGFLMVAGILSERMEEE